MKTEAIEEGVREVLTLTQFLKMPEIKPALEFIRGRVAQKVSPNFHHSRIQTKLPARINDFSEAARLGVAFGELRCSFGGESYVPDISFFTIDRIPVDSDGNLIEQKSTIPPDFSVEILSPGQTVAKLSARLQRLIRKGVRMGWLIQPRRDRVFVFLPDQPVRELGRGDVLSGEEVLPGFDLPVEELFGWLHLHRN